MCSTTDQGHQKQFEKQKQPRQIVVVTGGNSDIDSTLVREGSSVPTWNVVQLTCPGNANEQREYIQLGNNRRDVFELQALVATEFGSCFVENHVVGSPILHVMSRIDPLFWILTLFSPDYQAQSWEPLEQLLTCENDDNLSSILMQQDTTQWLHLFQALNMAEDGTAQDDDENFYKFRPKKALKWLERKQKSVYQHLMVTQKQQSATRKKNSNTGAFSSSFQLSTPAKPSNSTETPTFANSQDDPPVFNKKLWRESIQIVCTYLPSVWVQAFLKSLQEEIDVDAILWEKDSSKEKSSGPAKRFKNVDGSSPTKSDDDIHKNRNKENNDQTYAKQQPPQRAISHGIKKLAKVDKSGMKTMMHFFAKKK